MDLSPLFTKTSVTITRRIQQERIGLQLITLIHRCRKCGTECINPSNCDGCGEGPVEVWASDLRRFVDEKEASRIRAENRNEELARIRMEQQAERSRRTREFFLHYPNEFRNLIKDTFAWYISLLSKGQDPNHSNAGCGCLMSLGALMIILLALINGF